MKAFVTLRILHHHGACPRGMSNFQREFLPPDLNKPVSFTALATRPGIPTADICWALRCLPPEFQPRIRALLLGMLSEIVIPPILREYPDLAPILQMLPDRLAQVSGDIDQNRAFFDSLQTSMSVLPYWHKNPLVDTVAQLLDLYRSLPLTDAIFRLSARPDLGLPYSRDEEDMKVRQLILQLFPE